MDLACEIVLFLRWKKLNFMTIKLHCDLNGRRYRNFLLFFFNEGPQLLSYTVLSSATINMFIALSFFRDSNCNEQIIYTINLRVWIPWRRMCGLMDYWSQNNTFKLPRCTYKKINQHEIKDHEQHGKLPFIYNTVIYRLYLFVFLGFWALSHIREMRLFVFCCVLFCFVLFCFVCFRSRSHPVPHRGERVKQGTVHSRIIAIIT
jgi:hypothetical protein